MRRRCKRTEKQRANMQIAQRHGDHSSSLAHEVCARRAFEHHEGAGFNGLTIQCAVKQIIFAVALICRPTESQSLPNSSASCADRFAAAVNASTNTLRTSCASKWLSAASVVPPLEVTCWRKVDADSLTSRAIN